ncbi:MAG: Rieske 2Fe-2S domain-containing protein [Chloroflexi bacterium]|nr:Rieske 2Fe-2S domain-containing protein [Chloroflexota bacterium]
MVPFPRRTHRMAAAVCRCDGAISPGRTVCTAAVNVCVAPRLPGTWGFPSRTTRRSACGPGRTSSVASCTNDSMSLHRQRNGGNGAPPVRSPGRWRQRASMPLASSLRKKDSILSLSTACSMAMIAPTPSLSPSKSSARNVRPCPDHSSGYHARERPVKRCPRAGAAQQLSHAPPSGILSAANGTRPDRRGPSSSQGSRRMLTREENERLTQVGPGTAMGNLLRRYWHVVAARAELDEDPVRPVRLLGEDLTLFRDQRGRLGLIGERCAHRAISLAYGIPQEKGLRCAYHGWTYDTEGRVVDMPFEPACLPLRVTAYPVQEVGGLVFAYLGPEPTPLLPRHELFARDEFDKSVEITPLPCSWLQCMDNSLDPVHYEHLHVAYGNYVMKKLGKPPKMAAARHLKIDFDVFAYGVYKRRLVEGAGEDSDDWRIGHPILFPNTLLVGDAKAVRYQIRVPIDDSHTVHYNYNCWPRKNKTPAWEGIPVERTSLFEPNGSIVADSIVKQDMLGWVGQGPISDRTLEHLVTSDKGVILYHRMLLDEMEKVDRGEDPMGVVRDPAVNEPYIRIRWEDRAKEMFWPGGRTFEWTVPGLAHSA